MSRPVRFRTAVHAWAVCAAVLVPVLGCGGEDPPPAQPVPNAAEVRAFMGIVAGNCWRYRIPAGATSIFSNLSVAGPDERPIAGKSVYVRTYLSDSGNKSRQDLFDFSTESEMHLARSIDGRGAGATTKTYDTDPTPLFAKLEFDAANDVTFAEQIFKTTATPMGGAAEDHQWTVLGEKSVALHDGTTAMATELTYQVAGMTARYAFVPGYGFAEFTDFDNQTHQVCAACTAPTDGGCTTDMCSQLTCN